MDSRGRGSDWSAPGIGVYDAVLNEDERAFRRQVADLLRTDVHVGPRQYFHDRGPETRRIYQAVGSRGWLSLGWPTSAGGQAAPPSYEFLLWDTLGYFRACRPDIGPGMVARIVITHGSEDLKSRLLPGLAAGSLAMSLGYSEPESGSDLTHLKTQAVRDGDSYVVKGHKIWTSDAHHAEILWLLCRTGLPDSGSRGLTLLVVDMASPGISVTPIPTIDGHRINEVFLDDVIVPVANRVGDEGGAWSMMRESLAMERHIQVLPGRLRRDLEDLESILVDECSSTRSDWIGPLDELAQDLATAEASALTTVMELSEGSPAVRQAAQSKLLASRLSQKIPRVGLDLLGSVGVATDNEMAFLSRQSVLETIAGGTIEVMMSLLAREGLSLGSGR
jgi:3-oxocholest-4-en-26-oyl-CoA dehydrogenase alpha subunit